MTELRQTTAVVTQPVTRVTAVRSTVGLPGKDGGDGLPGQDGRDGFAGYRHAQTTLSQAWVVNHALQRQPVSVISVDDAGEEIQGNVVFNSPNSLTITFAIDVQGTAYCI